MKSFWNRFAKSRTSQSQRHRRRSIRQFETLERRDLLAGDVLPVLMVIADNQDFYYQEYGDTRIAIEAEGVSVQVAATTTNPSTPHANTGQGNSSGIVTPDLTLDSVNTDDYSAIVIVGGWGSSMYQYAFPGDYANDHYDGDQATKETVNNLINEFIADDKQVAAICHGVTVLAWARVDGVSPLDGKNISIPFIGSPAVLYEGAWYGYYELGQCEQATANGAIANTFSGQYGDPTTVEDDVVVDGNIITAENYDAASSFGLRVAQEVIAAAGIAEPAPENLPPIATDSTWQLDENSSAASVIGVVTAADPDVGQNLTFAIVAGNVDNAFAVDPNTGEVIVANESAIDFETTPEFQLLIEVTDDAVAPMSDTALVTIQLNDLDETPPSSVFQLGEDLIVQGTATDDTVYLWSGSTDEQIFVWMNGVSYGSFAMAEGGRVMVYGDDGNDQIYATSARMAVSIYGEGGHDQITGGTAGDHLEGGDGVDRIWGSEGDDLIRGGAGNDFLFGREGNDILLGEDGDDYLDGDIGRDLVFGGLGSDYIRGGIDDDLLVGGYTAYDQDDSALRLIRDTWTGPGDIVQRQNALAIGIGLGIQLNSGTTVHDDEDADIICGGEDADLFFANLGDDVYSELEDLVQ